MKTYYINIFIMLAFFSSQAQEIIVPLENQFTYESDTNSPIYFKDVNNTLNKFTGDWVIDDGTNYLKISITKKIHMPIGFPGFNDPNYRDYLSLVLIYKVNDVEIYNTAATTSQDPHITGSTINNSNEVKLHYDEPTQSCRRQKSADLKLEFISDGTISQNGSLPIGTLKWTRINRLSHTSPNAECNDGTLIDSSEYTIPSEFILERE